MQQDFSLIPFLNEKRRELNKTLALAKERGEKYAEAERVYRIAKAKFIAIERDRRTPVTIISDLARGNEEIARLRKDRDMAKILYYNCVEAINVYKLECRLVEAQIGREWSK